MGYAIVKTSAGTSGGGSVTPVLSSIAATEIGPRYQQTREGRKGPFTTLWTVIKITPTFSVANYPASFYVWLDYDDGGGAAPIEGDPFTVALAGDSITINVPVPTNPANTSWTAYAIGGQTGTQTPPVGAVHASFTVAAVGDCPTTDITAAQFVENPADSDILTYTVAAAPGIYQWGIYECQWTEPSVAQDNNFWYSALTIQKGYSTSGLGMVTGGTALQSTSGAGFLASQVGMPMHVNGVAVTMATYVDAAHCTLSAAVPNGTGVAYEIWNEAPDAEGVNTLAADGSILVLGREVTAPSGQQDGPIGNTSAAIINYFGDNPPDWGIPNPKNPDGSTNLYVTYRFRIYAFSRLAADQTNGALPTLQTCWPGGADYFDATPTAQAAALDLGQVNLHTVGNNFGLVANKFTLLDNSVVASQMAADSITAANNALAANAVVDSNIAGVNVSKLIAGTNIFTGDVILSRGTGYPVIDMSSTGLFLFGVASGSTGLTADPYVAIESTGLSLIAGNFTCLVTASQIKLSDSSAGSLVLNSTGLGLYSVGTSTGSPYATFTPTALNFYYSASQYLQVNSSGVGAYYSSSVFATIASAGVSIVGGGIVLAPTAAVATAMMTAGQVTIAHDSTHYIGINAAGLGVVAGAASLTVEATGINISTSASFVSMAIATSGITITANSSTSMVLTAGSLVMNVPGNSGALNLTASSTIAELLLNANSGSTTAALYASNSIVELALTNSLGSGSTFQVSLVTSGSPFIALNGNKVLTIRQTGPGNPSFSTVGDAQTWCGNLLTALQAHGLVT